MVGGRKHTPHTHTYLAYCTQHIAIVMIIIVIIMDNVVVAAVAYGQCDTCRFLDFSVVTRWM